MVDMYALGLTLSIEWCTIFKMHTQKAKPSFIGIVRKVSKRYPLARQINACRVAGAEAVIELDGISKFSIETVGAYARPEFVYVLQHLFVVARRGVGAKVKRGDILTFSELVMERGAVILELATQRRSDDPQQWKAMRTDAMEMVTRDRLPPSGAPPGRPRKGSPEDDVKVRAIWESRKYATYTDCERAFPAKWGSWQKAYRMFGPRTDARPMIDPAQNRVYFIASGVKAVKIGYTALGYKRFEDLQIASHTKLRLIGMIEGDRTTEAGLHRRFAEYHIRGEWFSIEGELADYLKTVPKFNRRKG